MRRRNDNPKVRPAVPCGIDLGQPGTWVVELEGTTKSALEVGRTRLIVTGLLFALAFAFLGLRLVDLTVVRGDGDTRLAAGNPAEKGWQPSRAEIVDRNGEILAISLPATSLYANPRMIRDPDEAARRVSEILRDVSAERLRSDLESGRSFVWVKRCLSPRETAAVNRLGVVGLTLQRDECRSHPHGALTSQVVGFTDIDGRGIAGIELAFDDLLGGGTQPLQLSIDLRVQHIMTEELAAAIEEYGGIGGSALVMDVDSGEIIAMVSLPTYDPRRPAAAADEARFNRATLGVYEMGSVFKVFSSAAALDSGAVGLEDGFDTSTPIRVARFTINDFKPKNRWMSIPEIFLHSSNIGTVHMTMKAGTETLRHYLDDFGFLQEASLELPEMGRPMVPSPWREINTMTISYGHGLAVTPLQVTRAVAALVNGGELRPATLVRRLPGEAVPGRRVVDRQTSDQMRWLLRLVVAEGTGRSADAPGYLVGGKTGTANKLNPAGGYHRDKRIASFAGAFPMDAPRYVVFALVDEPKPTARSHGYATAGWVVAPMIGRSVERIAPLLGVRPRLRTPSDDDERDPLLVPAHLKGRELAAQ